jgi:hypothetical protein
MVREKGNPNKDGLLFNIIADIYYMCTIYAAVLLGNLVNRNKSSEEAVEELEFFR